MKTLKVKFVVIVTVVSLAIGTAAFFALKTIIDSVISEFGISFATSEARVRKHDILPVLQRELALAMKMANSPVLKRWARNEDDPAMSELAMKELESFRELFTDGSYFIAPVRTGNFYFNNAADEFKGRELRQHLDKDTEDDQWFFYTLKDVDGFDLNIDSNSVLGVTKVWLNVVMVDKGERIAVCGTGLDLSSFIKEVVRESINGVTTILTGENGDIKAHPDIRQIDFNAITKSTTKRKTIFALIDSKEEQSRLETAMSIVKQGTKEVETVFVTINDAKYIVSVAFMPELGWYDIVLVDVASIINVRKFHPFMLIFIFSLLAVVGVFISFMNRVVLRPLSRLTDSTMKIASGNYSVSAPVVSNDEIGALTDSFNKMATKVQDYTLNLEVMIRQRTEQLNNAIDASRRIVESVPDAIVIVDSTGQIIMINEQTHKLLGYEKEELIGKEVEILVPHRFREKHRGYHDNFMENVGEKRAGWTMELLALSKDEHEIPVDISLSILDVDNGRQIICSMRDITERKRTESLKAEKDMAVQAAAIAEAARAEAEATREELRTKVIEIERFNRIAMGREERIVELKKELDSMAQQAGLTLPYAQTGLEVYHEDSLDTHENRIDADSMSEPLTQLLNLSQFQQLLTHFCNSVGIAAAIIDTNGNVMAAARWQRACTDFHRVNEASCALCMESDTELSSNLKEGKAFSIYQCKNGLTDAASPITINGIHIANAFVGQFFLNPPDLEYFRRQALVYGFDHEPYLAAIKDVPVIAQEKLPGIMGFLVDVAALIATISMERLRAQNAEVSMSKRAGELSHERAIAISLAEDSNLARSELELYKNHLEHLVSERTEELNKHIQNLERFAKLTVGRELKMIRLKDEINELLQCRGLPAKYKIVK